MVDDLESSLSKTQHDLELQSIKADVAYRRGQSEVLAEQSRNERLQKTIEKLLTSKESLERTINQLRVKHHRQSFLASPVSTRHSHREASAAIQFESETFKRHVTADKLNGFDLTDTPVFVDQLKQFIAEYGATHMLSIVESLVPSSFWSFVGDMCHHSLSKFVKLIMSGEVDCGDWFDVWYNHVPGDWVMLLCGATSNDRERNEELGEEHERRQLNRSISVLSILCNMLNSQCTKLTQENVSMILSQSSRITGKTMKIFNQLGYSMSERALSNHRKCLFEQGDTLIKEYIKLLKRFNYTIAIMFDNCDWIGLHIMFYVGNITTSPSEELRSTFPKRVHIRDLTLDHFELNDDEDKALKKCINRRVNRACIILNDIKSDIEALSDPINVKLMVEDHDARNKSKAKLGRKKSIYTGTSKPSLYNEMMNLEKESLLKTVTIQQGYSAPVESSGFRSPHETKPLTVSKDDIVEVLFRDHKRKIAAIKTAYDKTGWVPLFCITGDQSDEPDDERSYLVTPTIDRTRSRFHSRMEARGVLTCPEEEHLSLEDDVCQSLPMDEHEGSSMNEGAPQSEALPMNEGEPLPMDEDAPQSETARANPQFRDQRKLDPEFIRLVKELVKSLNNVSPSNIMSFLPLFTYLGVASSLSDVLDSFKIIKEMFGDYPWLFMVSDTQEFQLIHDFRDKLRIKIQQKIDTFRKWNEQHLDAASAAAVRSNELSIVKLKLQLDKIDDERAHFWGPFHGVMGGIRGWNGQFGSFLLKPMLDWIGYSEAYNSLLVCAYGYHKMAIDVSDSMFISWVITGLSIYETLKLDEDKQPLEKLDIIAKDSTTFQYYDLIVRHELGKLLNLEDSGKLNGVDGFNLLTAAIKQMVGYYAMSGNYNLTYAAAVHIRETKTSKQEECDTYRLNCNAENKKTKKSSPHDRAMETNIKELKQTVGSVNEHNIQREAQNVRVAPGVIHAFSETLFGKEKFEADGEDSKNVIDREQAVLSMCVAFKLSLSKQIISEFNASRSGESAEVPPAALSDETFSLLKVAPPSNAVSKNVKPKTLQVRTNWYDSYKLDQTERHKQVVSFVTRTAIGGVNKPDSVKRRMFTRRTLDAEAKKRTTKNLTKSLNSQFMFFGYILKDHPDLFNRYTLMGMVKDGQLRKAAKAKIRDYCNKEFFTKHNDKNVVYYRKNPSNPCIMESVSLYGEDVKEYYINGCIYDGNAFIRQFREYSSSTFKQGELTGTSQLMDFIYQVMKEELTADDLDDDHPRTLAFIMDLGQCLQKKIEEQRRDLSKQNVAYGMKKLTPGPLDSNYRPSYIMDKYNDRSVGGGREELVGVFGEVFSQLGLSNNRNHKLMELLEHKKDVNLLFSGIGGNVSERKKTRHISIDDDVVNCSFDDETDHNEDSKVIFEAFNIIKKENEDGKYANVLVKMPDTDGWLIAVLMYSLQDDPEEMGTIFIETTNKIVGGVDTNIINCKEAMYCIERDPRLLFLDKFFKVPTFIAICIALGGDTTHATKGVTHLKGIPWILNQLKWIGSILREPTQEERDDGFNFGINYTAFQRMFMLIHAQLHHSAICDRWDSKGVTEQGRYLDEIGYAEFEKVIGLVALKEMGFMPSEANMEFIAGRTLSRLQTWLNTLIPKPIPFPIKGFDVIVMNENGQDERVSEPRPDSIDFELVGDVQPKFTLNDKGEWTNTLLTDMFKDGIINALAKQKTNEAEAKEKKKTASKLCGKCQHPFHKKTICSFCPPDECNEENLCVEVCKKCKHPPHKGAKCSQCINKGYQLGRCNCISVCALCRKPLIDDLGEACICDQSNEDGDESESFEEAIQATVESLDNDSMVEVCVGVADDEARAVVLENMEEWSIE
mmetsp:Transcript_32620/g.38274  ORF Transcript_32620/g.38274 Transcript_32620/m.38274 type:complete len:1849 (+) Transcript_32620:1794-7340(+)